MTDKLTMTGDLHVDIDSLKRYPGNPRVGSLRTIAKSLEANGQYRPVVVNARTLEILAGNHTWQAAKALGWKTIAATFVDVDDDTARRIVLVDNRANDLADYEDAALVDLLMRVQSEDTLVGTGYTDDDVAKMLEKIGEGFDESDTAPVELEGSFEVVITCEDEAQQVELIDRLIAEGLRVRAIVT